MNNIEIRKKFHTDHIADKAFSIVQKKAGSDKALVNAGIQAITVATMEEVYLMGWRDALATAETPESNPFSLYPINRNRITKPLKECEIDYEAINNAKDIGKLDISVLGLSKRVYFKLQERGIQTIAELMAKIDQGNLKKVRGIGDAAYEEIARQVKKADLRKQAEHSPSIGT